MTTLCQKMQQFKVCSIWKPFETMDILQRAQSPRLYEFLSSLTFLGLSPLRRFDKEFEDMERFTCHFFWHAFYNASLGLYTFA